MVAIMSQYVTASRKNSQTATVQRRQHEMTRYVNPLLKERENSQANARKRATSPAKAARPEGRADAR